MAEVNARDAKMIQYLNEAYGKEKQLETALGAHIKMTTRAPYKKRLQQHLKETKDHGRQLERRIKKLGGVAEARAVPEAVTEAAQAVQNVANRAAALAQGPLHTLRGTGEEEKLLKNAKTEFQDEAEEIATYTAIEAFAENVGDKETAQIVKKIRREEERMQNFLGKLIPQLAKAVAVAEIPASERATTTRRRAASSRSTSATGRSSSSSSRSSGSRSSASRSSGSGSRSSRSSSSGSGSSGSGSRSSSSRSSGSGSRSSSSRSSGSTRSRSRSNG